MTRQTRGMSLIETLIYISLLSILMIGVFSSVYVIIHSNEKENRVNETNYDLLLANYF